MAAALGVVGYSLVTVVDMACDITLPAACLLDELLADLACELRYQQLACWTRFLLTWPVSYATSCSPVGRVSRSTATRNRVDQAWLGLGRAFQCILFS